MRGYIYLAGPYSHKLAGIRHSRFMALTRKTVELMNEGHVVYSPITHGHTIAEHFELPKDFTWWKKHCTEMLRHSSKLVVVLIEGYADSAGVAAEIKIAQSCGIPIEYINP